MDQIDPLWQTAVVNREWQCSRQPSSVHFLTIGQLNTHNMIHHFTVIHYITLPILTIINLTSKVHQII